jgi:predicted DNA-binding protein
MGDEPSRYTKYVLNWTAEMQERVAVLAGAREMPKAVWVREAIREKLERDEPKEQR